MGRMEPVAERSAQAHMFLESHVEPCMHVGDLDEGWQPPPEVDPVLHVGLEDTFARHYSTPPGEPCSREYMTGTVAAPWLPDMFQPGSSSAVPTGSHVVSFSPEVTVSPDLPMDYLMRVQRMYPHYSTWARQMSAASGRSGDQMSAAASGSYRSSPEPPPPSSSTHSHSH